MSDSDGGPAFPLQDWDPCIHSQRSETGMSMRQFYKAAALMACPDAHNWHVPVQNIAKRCADLADAMVREDQEESK